MPTLHPIPGAYVHRVRVSGRMWKRYPVGAIHRVHPDKKQVLAGLDRSGTIAPHGIRAAHFRKAHNLRRIRKSRGGTQSLRTRSDRTERYTQSHRKTFRDTFLTIRLFHVRIPGSSRPILRSGIRGARLYENPFARSHVHVPGKRGTDNGTNPEKMRGTGIFRENRFPRASKRKIRGTREPARARAPHRVHRREPESRCRIRPGSRSHRPIRDTVHLACQKYATIASLLPS